LLEEKQKTSAATQKSSKHEEKRKRDVMFGAGKKNSLRQEPNSAAYSAEGKSRFNSPTAPAPQKGHPKSAAKKRKHDGEKRKGGTITVRPEGGGGF